MKIAINKWAAILFSGIALSTHAFADWSLDNETSNIHFVSTKKCVVGEVHQFNKLSGSISKGGQAEVNIDLSSVDTGIGIRDTRMKAMLFNVEKFAQANIRANIDTKKLTALKPGETYEETVKVTLSLHGHEKSLSALLRIVKLANNSVLVSSVKPIVIKASDFKLGDGIEKLKQAAALPSISGAVPVSIDLTFKK